MILSVLPVWIPFVDILHSISLVLIHTPHSFHLSVKMQTVSSKEHICETSHCWALGKNSVASSFAALFYARKRMQEFEYKIIQEAKISIFFMHFWAPSKLSLSSVLAEQTCGARMHQSGLVDGHIMQKATPAAHQAGTLLGCWGC